MGNVKMLREVADRVDPEILTPGIAGYDQSTYGERFDVFNLDEIVHECNTVCCVGGHAFILAYGMQEYLDHINEGTDWEIAESARKALGLTEEEADALFDTWIYGDVVENVFGVKVGWETTENENDVAELLRDIATKIEEQPND